MFGLLPRGFETVLDNLIHLTLGVLDIGVGFFLGDRSGSRVGALATFPALDVDLQHPSW